MISQMPDLTTSGTAISAALAFERAGVKADDIDILALYDAFTIGVILFLEDLGYCCKRAKSSAFVSGGGSPPATSLRLTHRAVGCLTAGYVRTARPDRSGASGPGRVRRTPTGQ